MKISRSKYKTYGQDIGFKNRGNSLQISIDRIRQQNQNKLTGLERLQKQEEDQAKQNISDLRANEASRSEVARINRNLEVDIYRKKRDAIEVTAARTVENIRGQAEEAGKTAAFWQDFSTTGVKNYAQLAQGLFGYLEYREGQDLVRKSDPEWLQDAGDELLKQIKNIEKDGFEASIGRDDNGNLLHPITKKEINARAGNWNGYYHNYEAQDFKKQREAVTAWLEQNARFEDGSTMLTPSLAPSVFASLAYNILAEKDIPVNSKAGQDIIRTATNWGRDLGIERQGAWQANEDASRVKLKARNLATELRTYLGQKSGTKEQKITIEHLNTTFKSIHPILEGSIFEISKGKYGLKNDWTQATLAEEVIRQVFPYVKDLPYGELHSTLNKMLAFSPKSGKPIKEKGTTIGVIDKVPDVGKLLTNLYKQEQKKQKEALEVEQEKDRQTIIAPAEDAFDRCSRDKKDCGDWESMRGDLSRSLAQPLFDGNKPLRDKWQARVGYNEKSHGSLFTYTSTLAKVESGDIDGAMNILVARGTKIESGYLNDERFESLRASINAIKSVGGIKTIEEYAIDIYNDSKTPGRTILRQGGSRTTTDSRIINALKSHIIREITANTSDNPGHVKVEAARDKVSKAFTLGLEQGKGFYAAIDAAKAHWTPATVDEKTNKVTEAGGYGKKTANSVRADNPTGFIFKTFDNRLDTAVTWEADAIKNTFFGDKTQEGDIQSYSTTNLADRIAEELQDENFLREDEKRDIQRIVYRGAVTEDDVISPNLKVLTVLAHQIDPKLTQRDVMNMVVAGLAQHESGTYKGLNGKAYPMGLDDLTKKITGSCSTNHRNNFSKCVVELAKQNNLNVNSDRPVLGSGDILHILKVLDED